MKRWNFLRKMKLLPELNFFLYIIPNMSKCQGNFFYSVRKKNSVKKITFPIVHFGGKKVMFFYGFINLTYFYSQYQFSLKKYKWEQVWAVFFQKKYVKFQYNSMYTCVNTWFEVLSESVTRVTKTHPFKYNY